MTARASLRPSAWGLTDARIEAFIRTNVTALLQHWRGETDSSDLLDALQPPGESTEAAENIELGR